MGLSLFNKSVFSQQSSSTYESIYEPINPRPPSQMSSRSNYSLYAPYVSGNSSTMTGPSQSASRIEVNKLQEVDSLTDLLVQGMDNEQDQDVYGVCVKCGEKIIGENSGCTAMDQFYHTKCFTCHHCAINLQGKPFYALDGNPYCEEDYLVSDITSLFGRKKVRKIRFVTVNRHIIVKNSTKTVTYMRWNVAKLLFFHFSQKKKNKIDAAIFTRQLAK